VVDGVFLDTDGKILKPPPTILVIFGASGDLTQRKLVPGCYNLFCDGLLPDHFRVLGLSRTPLSDDAFREKLKEGVSKYSRSGLDENKWNEFAKQIFYLPLDVEKPEDFEKLRTKLDTLGSGSRTDYLYYLAVSPSLFGNISKKLKGAKLIEPTEGAIRKTRLIVEKPFGYDTESAQKLAKELYESSAESQLFRIDHYLGKETVQNILVFRFANGLFEPMWNRKYIDQIQISVCEDIGVENRGPYFDNAGIVRDFIQNHVFQMLSLLCIEPPNSLMDAEGIRDEKVKVLKSIKRFSVDDVLAKAIRGQYIKGAVKGSEVQSYREEKGVNPESMTETFAAMALEIENWRWEGVPIFIRVGKRLAKRVSEIAVYFKKVPESLFRGRQVEFLEPNVLRIQVQPKEGISLRVNSKPPGPILRVAPVEMDFTYQSSFGVASPEAYERLLLDAMKGDATLFTRQDEIEESWNILKPIFDVWTSNKQPELYTYNAGTWGPKEANSLVKKFNFNWSRF